MIETEVPDFEIPSPDNALKIMNRFKNRLGEGESNEHDAQAAGERRYTQIVKPPSDADNELETNHLEGAPDFVIDSFREAASDIIQSAIEGGELTPLAVEPTEVQLAPSGEMGGESNEDNTGSSEHSMLYIPSETLKERIARKLRGVDRRRPVMTSEKVDGYVRKSMTAPDPRRALLKILYVEAFAGQLTDQAGKIGQIQAMNAGAAQLAQEIQGGQSDAVAVRDLQIAMENMYKAAGLGQYKPYIQVGEHEAASAVHSKIKARLIKDQREFAKRAAERELRDYDKLEAAAKERELVVVEAAKHADPMQLTRRLVRQNARLLEKADHRIIQTSINHLRRLGIDTSDADVAPIVTILKREQLKDGWSPDMQGLALQDNTKLPDAQAEAELELRMGGARLAELKQKQSHARVEEWIEQIAHGSAKVRITRGEMAGSAQTRDADIICDQFDQLRGEASARELVFRKAEAALEGGWTRLKTHLALPVQETFDRFKERVEKLRTIDNAVTQEPFEDIALRLEMAEQYARETIGALSARVKADSAINLQEARYAEIVHYGEAESARFADHIRNIGVTDTSASQALALRAARLMRRIDAVRNSGGADDFEARAAAELEQHVQLVFPERADTKVRAVPPQTRQAGPQRSEEPPESDWIPNAPDTPQMVARRSRNEVGTPPVAARETETQHEQRPTQAEFMATLPEAVRAPLQAEIDNSTTAYRAFESYRTDPTNATLEACNRALEALRMSWTVLNRRIGNLGPNEALGPKDRQLLMAVHVQTGSIGNEIANFLVHKDDGDAVDRNRAKERMYTAQQQLGNVFAPEKPAAEVAREPEPVVIQSNPEFSVPDIGDAGVQVAVAALSQLYTDGDAQTRHEIEIIRSMVITLQYMPQAVYGAQKQRILDRIATLKQ